MTITFTSTIQEFDNPPKIISFTAKVKISQYKIFQVYEFEEPKNKQWNRIEISPKKVNIFTGSLTLNLELKKNVENIYYVDKNNYLKYKVFTEMIQIQKNYIVLKYNIHNNDKDKRFFKLQLKINS